MVAQSRSAEKFLRDKKLHAFTVYGGGLDGLVWMNLGAWDGQGMKARPVRLHKNTPAEVTADLFCRSDSL